MINQAATINKNALRKWAKKNEKKQKVNTIKHLGK